MTEEDHDRLRLDVAGYVLGGLTPAEQHSFEAHLATCPTCQAELADLDPLPVLLDLARPSPVPAGSIGEPAHAPAPAAAPAAGRRRARVLVGAALVVAALAGLALGVRSTRGSTPSFSTPVTLQAVDAPTGPASDPVSVPVGTAAWRATENGTVVRLDLSGLSHEGTYYECVWISGSGDQSAGTFRAATDGRARVELTTAASRYPGWRLEIRAHTATGGSPDGTPILQASA